MTKVIWSNRKLRRKLNLSKTFPVAKILRNQVLFLKASEVTRLNTLKDISIFYLRRLHVYRLSMK